MGLEPEFHLSGADSWNGVGMRLAWTKPVVPGESEVTMLDPMEIRLCLECKKPIPLRDVTAYAWSNIFYKDNIEGGYQQIPLPYEEGSRKWTDMGVTTYEFATSIHPSSPQKGYRLTFHVLFRDVIVWADKFEEDHVIDVLPPRALNDYTKVAHLAMITPKLFIGNALSVKLADENEFDAVVVLDKHVKDQAVKGARGRDEELFCIPLPIGAGNALSEHKIKHIVSKLQHLMSQGKRVLVGDTYGEGRVGSVATAYLFANNPNLTFEEAYAFVKKHNAFCHKGLCQTLYSLYPRD